MLETRAPLSKAAEAPSEAADPRTGLPHAFTSAYECLTPAEPEQAGRPRHVARPPGNAGDVALGPLANANVFVATGLQVTLACLVVGYSSALRLSRHLFARAG